MVCRCRGSAPPLLQRCVSYFPPPLPSWRRRQQNITADSNNTCRRDATASSSVSSRPPALMRCFVALHSCRLSDLSFLHSPLLLVPPPATSIPPLLPDATHTPTGYIIGSASGNI